MHSLLLRLVTIVFLFTGFWSASGQSEDFPVNSGKGKKRGSRFSRKEAFAVSETGGKPPASEKMDPSNLPEPTSKEASQSIQENSIPTKPSQKPVEVMAQPQGFERFQWVSKRNIFDPSRRPMEVLQPSVEPPPPPPPPKPERLIIRGVVDHATKACAFLSSNNGFRVLPLNGELAGVRLVSVNSKQVEFSRKEEKLTVPVGCGIELSEGMGMKLITEKEVGSLNPAPPPPPPSPPPTQAVLPGRDPPPLGLSLPGEPTTTISLSPVADEKPEDIIKRLREKRLKEIENSK